MRGAYYCVRDGVVEKGGRWGLAAILEKNALSAILDFTRSLLSSRLTILHTSTAHALPLSFLYPLSILVRQHLHEPLEVLLAQLPAKERLDIKPISRLLIDACAGLRLEEGLLREH